MSDAETVDQLDEARAELHEAQRIAALLAVDEDQAPADAVAVAGRIIERDLAARRIEAWSAVVDKLCAEGARRGLFA